ncbi:hypothetical protein Ahy_B07g087711 [Arachis hypogaea]|uniref:Pentatricopeptide repeat-containing protein n=1 Tax=Arachis hypogaea TaxID=3818 RepID=A0A444YCS0_ARAHY|nr:hypothetical protein Ahy_B07g087711 [Arachis hypogaea]
MLFGYARIGNIGFALERCGFLELYTLVCYLQNGTDQKAIDIFKRMRSLRIPHDYATFAVVLKAYSGIGDYCLGLQVHCLASRMGFDNDIVTASALVDIQLHGHALKFSFEYDTIVGTATLDMFSKCNRRSDARKLFNSLPNPTRQSYNAIIVGYARQDQGLKALENVQSLKRSYLGFDEINLSGALTACAAIKSWLDGIQLHGLAIKCGLIFVICVANAILDMYGKCGGLMESCLIFDEMKKRDVVSWNAIILAHEQNEEVETTLLLFISILWSTMEPDDFTYGSVVKACAAQQALNYGMEIHGQIIKSELGLDSFVGSSLVDMYCKCGMLEEAEKIHYILEGQTMASWNSILSGFSSQKQSENAQKHFSQMLEMGVIPDNFTYATVLDICANLATVELGKQIHAQILKL